MLPRLPVTTWPFTTPSCARLAFRDARLRPENLCGNQARDGCMFKLEPLTLAMAPFFNLSLMGLYQGSR